MSWFSNLFGTDIESAKYWRSRAESLEIELKNERERNRIRENFLFDRALKAHNLQPIRAEAERIADLGGFEREKHLVQFEMLTKAERERESLEKQAFIKSCLDGGMSEQLAEQNWEAEKAEIINQ